MTRIFITGATGNVGMEVIRYLLQSHSGDKIMAGVRNIEKAELKFTPSKNLDFVTFDFELPETFDTAFKDIDTLFLLRPPHLSDVQKYFVPLLDAAQRQRIRQIVFLSVQGAEKSSIIPHNKIEKMIVKMGVDHVFLRPSYFMQNLTTTLLNDIRNKKQIMLPAGNAVFNWIDVGNIGEVAAAVLERFGEFRNQAIEITGNENKNFKEVVQIIKEETGQTITFVSPDPIRYYVSKKREGMDTGMILVMIMLHFLPRFQKPPQISGFYEKLTSKAPTSVREFIRREKTILS